MTNDDDKAYRLTPKGWLSRRLGFPAGMDALWMDFAEFVAKQAKANGLPDGVPCLVMVDGGVCITAEKEAKR